MPPSAVSSLPSRILRALATGLLIAQAIAGLQVALSNRVVLARAAGMAAEGYLTIPNAEVQAQLGHWGTAMAGGLFFTLSIGAGLTVASVLLAQTAALLGDRRRGVLVLALTLLALALLRLNLDAIQPLGSLYILLVPTGAWWAFHYRQTPTGGRQGMGFVVALVLPAVLLTLLWLPQKDAGLFTRIRDQLLLGNPIGQGVNDYYYRHTLPPAEVFKPLDQLTLKAVARSELQALPERVRARVASSLARWDYLPVADDYPPDLHVAVEGDEIVLADGRGHRHRAALDSFLANPGEALGRFSQEIDGKAFFRTLTFYGLLLGFPLCLYLLAFSGLALLVRPLFGRAGSIWWAGALCLLLGAAAWWPVNAGRTAPLSRDEIGPALAAADLPKRLAALRRIHDEKLDVGRWPHYRQLLDMGGIAERYWLARALAVSRSPATHGDLLRLTEDEHPNVVCQAYYALGRRGSRRSVAVITQQLKTSTHWYAQWYGYRALKALGWRQKPSL